MKTIILIVLLMATIYSQPTLTLDSAEVTKLNLMLDTLDYLREQVKLDSIELAQCDSIIKLDNRIIDNLQSQVFTLQEMQKQPAEKESFFKWSGFWLGLSTSYGFDSIITKSTVLAKLEWEITATARITINSKWELNGGAVLPLKEKFKLKVGIGYLIF